MIKNAKNVRKEKQIRLHCEFVGFKNGRLNYKYKEYKESCTKVVYESIKKNFQPYINFAMVIPISFFFS